MVEFTLPAHGGSAAEFVNGGYSIDRILTRLIDGREIVYGEGSACLDNSCCGSYVCSYLLIYGERVAGATDSEAWTVRSLDDAQLAESIRQELSRSHPGETVNVYHPPHRTPSSEPAVRPRGAPED